MAREHLLRLLAKYHRSLPCRNSLGALHCPQEKIALRQQRTEYRSEERDPRRDPEEATPCRLNFRHKEKADDDGEGASNWVGLLKHPTGQATKLHREILQRARTCHTPDATHGNTEQRANRQELVKRLDEGGTELQDGN